VRTLVFIISMALSAVLFAKVEALVFETPEQEASYKRLIGELRCLVCQNQNIADSNAELAQDLRARTYDLIKQGKSEQEIIDHMVQRYGDFVMYRPPLKSTTLFLWAGPFILMIVAVVLVLLYVRRRRNEQQETVDGARLDAARKLLESEKE
jgi:cytochrome c-type biogenesis protein CcmH